jgi:hypothetical protein
VDEESSIEENPLEQETLPETPQEEAGSGREPLVVHDDVTLLRDDFNDPKISSENWNWENPGLLFTQRGTGTVNIRDGYAFLILTKTKGDACAFLEREGEALKYGYTGMEIRMRYINDNRSKSDIGGVLWWGFSVLGLSDLRFVYLPSELGEDAEFRVHSGHLQSPRAGGLWEPIPDIDITDWHTYTILWHYHGYNNSLAENMGWLEYLEIDGAFLVDGEVVAATDKAEDFSPHFTEYLHNVIYIGNDLYWSCESWEDWGSIYDSGKRSVDIPFNQSLQIDYVHIFTSEEDFEEMGAETSELLSDCLQIIEELEWRGLNTTQLRAWYTNALNDWQSGDYLWNSEIYSKFLHHTENWEEIPCMFAQASDCIETLKQEGTDQEVWVSNYDYTKAVDAWAQYDYGTTRQRLQRIIDRVPEPTLLTILGLILLPALLRRKN